MILGYMSDEGYFANATGGAADYTPDFLLGRWPVHSVSETNAIADKILAYEGADSTQAWAHDAVFVADDDPSFESAQDRRSTPI